MYFPHLHFDSLTRILFSKKNKVCFFIFFFNLQFENEITDNIVLDSTDGTSDAGGRIMTEDSIIQVNGSDSTKQIIHLERPYTYKGVPHENNNGFLFHRHQIDQRVSV